MFRRTTTSPRTADRLSYLWLALAAALLLFAAGRWAIPLAAWLAPLFLLRFVRTQRLLPGLLLAWIVRAAVAAVVQRGIILYPGMVYYVVVALLTLLTMLPYLADLLLAHRLRGLSATLVFPVAYTALEYLTSFGPSGAFNSIANTQYGNLPLMQVAAVTGIWGITFLMTWFAAVANWAWERGFAWSEVRGPTMLYGGVLTTVLLGGGARLALGSSPATTVRVAGLSASRAAVAALDRQLPQATLVRLQSGKATPSDRAVARAALAVVYDDLLGRSRQEARAGARIVVWPEVSPEGAQVLQEDEPELIQRAGALARQEGIYLDLGLGVFLRDAGGGPPLRDEAVLLDPAGHVVWTYEKTHPAPGEQGLIVPGDGKVPVAASPYGRLANLICFDLDYPGTVRRAGQAGVDVLLAPSDDWQAIDPAHTQAAVFRAIENGFALVRPASKGLSMAVDGEGRVLAASDYFTTGQQVMVAYVPTHGVRTIYAMIGDLFAWLCMAALVGLVALAILDRRERRSSAPAPLPQPAR
jgi:apolipoprotein N-acyltransferase